MSAVRKLESISVDDYLAGELTSSVKHEYVGGRAYAMAGATNVHNEIAANILTALKVKLRGRPCRPVNSDTKVRLRVDGERVFYYPDVTVTCRPNPPDDVYQDEPTAIFEVISESTRRIDEGEKKAAYLAHASVLLYALVEVHSPRVVLYRRSGTQFVREIYDQIAAVMPLGELGVDLALIDVYENVNFSAPSAD